MSEFKSYLVSYRHDGGEWNIELPATSIEDARQRLSQLHFGRVEGEVIARIPSSLGPIAMLAAWARNAVSTLSR
ncbi:hypothetical protein [Sphingopyxis sp.]|uniref:hypothetical protein n=1 Tax=Sphingopyxis sp. TaxID=1908224 RepID=UPI0035AEC80C